MRWVLQPPLCLDHLKREGCRHQHLRKQSIGIKRDRREQRIKLLRVKTLLLCRGGRSLLRPRARRPGRREHQNCGKHDRAATEHRAPPVSGPVLTVDHFDKNLEASLRSRGTTRTERTGRDLIESRMELNREVTTV